MRKKQTCDSLDSARRTVSAQIDPIQKARMGQYFTPASVAGFMASLFTTGPFRECRLLDPGAGIGMLASAFLNRCADGGLAFRRVAVDAYELDERLLLFLTQTLENGRATCPVVVAVHGTDFISLAEAEDLFNAPQPTFTHAILNPPYKKIRNDSPHRLALRRAGIETVNLYSAFTALALALLADGGQLVAIIPRSFCNGPYYKPFRKFILNRAAIRRIHLFHARDKAFRDDHVLQENVILFLERGGRHSDVTVSSSTDDCFTDVVCNDYPFSDIVEPDDPECFIRVPDGNGQESLGVSGTFSATLDELGITVSTGPVVDFRLRSHLRREPASDTVPLLYPGHFSGGKLDWPKKDFRKPNALAANGETEKWLYPKGFYTVVRRFSAKEEKRRVVASVVDMDAFPGKESLGFENHLNVFHNRRHGLMAETAYGLAAYLNTHGLDRYFRSFNGHTQVNATDLRQLRYPSREVLDEIGRWLMDHPGALSEPLDEKFKEIAR
jgi:adenine-specific DNA-methyltransferase